MCSFSSVLSGGWFMMALYCTSPNPAFPPCLTSQLSADPHTGPDIDNLRLFFCRFDLSSCQKGTVHFSLLLFNKKKCVTLLKFF
jgi:hypothetical protein